MTDDDPYAPEPATNSPTGSDSGEPQATPRPSTGTNRWVPPTAEELARLLPQYRIECMLGHGGMGAVYKGLQPVLDRPVAIKLLPAELSADEQFVSRFKREARTLAKLHHPGIVAVYDFGQTSEGHLYFVMEYVAGTDLRRVLQGPGLNPDQAFVIIGQICEALQAAHEQGVIHRDIKPANILIADNGQVKLADFGLSRPQQEDDTAGLTMTNVVMGTHDYMSPEQRSGYSDHRTDIYALGIMLYEMLTGRPPRGAFVPVSRKIQVDVRIDEVVLKALQEEPDLRYQQASELKRDVEHIRTSKLEPVAPVPVVTPPPRRRGLALALLILILLIGIGGYFFWGKWNPPAAVNQQAIDWYPPEGTQPAATKLENVFRVPLTVSSCKKGSWDFENLRDTSDPSWGRADALPEKPPQIKSVPNLQNPTYFRIPLGNHEFLAILDVGKDAGKAALYIDFDGQGLFEAIKGIEGADEFKGRTPDAKFNFGPVTLPKTKEAVAGPVEVMFSCSVNSKDPTKVQNFRITPQKFVHGFLHIGSEGYSVAFVDGAFAGRYQTFNPSIVPSARTRVQRFGATRMGVIRGKKEGSSYVMHPFVDKEIFPLVDLVRINDKYYNVSIAPDGSEAKFQEAKPEVGVLDTKCPGMEMSVVSDKCAALLTPNADGKWELPPGKYTYQSFTLSQMVGGKKWTLAESNQSTQARYFEIKAGIPTVLPLGPLPTATPEPKATPSPKPDVIAWLLEKKERWPKEVKLTQPITFPVFVGGKAPGSTQAPAGTMATVTNLQAGQVTLLWMNNAKTVPVDATDLLARASDSLAKSQPAPAIPTVVLANEEKTTGASDLIVPLTVYAFEKNSPYEALRPIDTANALRNKPASQIKSVPNLQNPTYYRLSLGNREFLAILDVGKDAEKATLYIDFDGQGLFEAIKGIEGVDEFKGQTPPATYAKFNFGPVTLPKTEEAVAGPVEVMVTCHALKKDATIVMTPRITPQKFVFGKLRLGSEEYAVAFVDGSFAGRYQTFNPSIEQPARPRDQRFGATKMAVDLDQNGEFDYYKEFFPLVDLVRLNDKYYRVSIAPDGSEAKFQEAKPEVGVLDTKCPDMEMFVLSDKCAALLTANADGKWELPPGKYTNRGFALSRMVNDKKWTLDGSKQSTQARYFEIKAGIPTVLPLGPPLALSYSLDKTSGGAVAIGLHVAGISGEIYSSGWPAPKITITSETGENLAQGTFENGIRSGSRVGSGTFSGRVYADYYSWQAPPDFTGGFRIQTKANLGPFDYKQSDQVFHLK